MLETIWKKLRKKEPEVEEDEDESTTITDLSVDTQLDSFGEC